MSRKVINVVIGGANLKYYAIDSYSGNLPKETLIKMSQLCGGVLEGNSVIGPTGYLYPILSSIDNITKIAFNFDMVVFLGSYGTLKDILFSDEFYDIISSLTELTQEEFYNITE